MKRITANRQGATNRGWMAVAAAIVIGLACAPAPHLHAEQACDMEKAVARFNDNDLDAAEACFTTIVEQDPDQWQAHCHLGRIAMLEGEIEGSIEGLKTAVDLHRDDSTCNHWLAEAYLQKLQQASFFEKGILAGRVLDHLKRAVELDPSNVPARISLASYYLNAPSIGGGSTKKAKEQVEVVSRMSPQHGHSLMVQIHLKEGNPDLAARELEAYLSTNPGDPDTLYQVGMLYQKIERWDEAFEAFEMAIAADPEALDSLYQVGRTAVFSGTRLERGIECLTEYLGRDLHPGVPGKDAAHWRLGMLYEKKADVDKAVAEYQTAIRINGDQQSYRDSLDAARKRAEERPAKG